jgi:hypothetical protein
MRLRYCAVMKHSGRGVALALIAFFPAIVAPARAQTSLDILEKDLDAVKQQHQDATSQNFTSFLSALEAAIQSPDAALQLYQKAGGDLPDATPITTKYEHETPDEKSARLAKDQSNLANFSAMLQLHCGMMRLAALFAEKPDSPTLHGDWIAWLKSTAQIYPQLSGAHHVRNMTMQDSPIGTYLGFHGWGNKDQGGWSVHDVPKFYHDQILEPLRHPAVAAALPAWDVYIAMRNADEPDADKWNNEEYPDLAFSRASDDFNLAPSTDKLQAIVELLKAHADSPKIDDWISQAHAMAEVLRARKAGVAAPTASATNAPSQMDSSVPVTNAPVTATTASTTNTP